MQLNQFKFTRYKFIYNYTLSENMLPWEVVCSFNS